MIVYFIMRDPHCVGLKLYVNCSNGPRVICHIFKTDFCTKIIGKLLVREDPDHNPNLHVIFFLLTDFFTFRRSEEIILLCHPVSCQTSICFVFSS